MSSEWHKQHYQEPPNKIIQNKSVPTLCEQPSQSALTDNSLVSMVLWIYYSSAINVTEICYCLNMIGDAVLQRPDSIVDIGVTNNANSYTLKPLYCSLVHCVLKKTSTIRSSPKAILIGGIESAEKSLAIRSEEYIPEY